MIKKLKQLTTDNVLRRIDLQFAKFVRQQERTISDEVKLDILTIIAAAVSNELSKGHSCLPVGKLTSNKILDLSIVKTTELISNLPPQNEWLDVVNEASVFSSGSTLTPLILDNNRLYIFNMWKHEQNVSNRIKSMSIRSNIDDNQFSTLKMSLDNLFPRPYHILFNKLEEMEGYGTKEDYIDIVTDTLDVIAPVGINWEAVSEICSTATTINDLSKLDKIIPDEYCLNWQKVAATTALTRQFCVISGGPGTGKTTTVTKLLAALIMSYVINNKQAPTIQLVAPTGKAAARLTESISKAVDSLDVPENIRNNIPTQASTIHRLLGARYRKAAFKHNNKNPLHCEVLVVDEASMVDLPMIDKLLDALPTGAKLILLGDKDQLASVEAGSVLGDICSFSDYPYSKEQSETVNRLTGYNTLNINNNNFDLDMTSPIVDSLCMLRKSYRFHSKSGIGQLAYAVNNGSFKDITKVFAMNFRDIEKQDVNKESYDGLIRDVADEYKDYLLIAKSGSKSPKAVLDAFSNIRLLCALREGNFGIEMLNKKIENRLISSRHITKSDGSIWYEGRPIMVTKNDHNMGLFNGDIGITMKDPETGSLFVYFEMSDGNIQKFLPTRIPPHEVVFAMTIHKSQGSEFASTYMLLPAQRNPVITRELIYTGITRAKKKLRLYSSDEMLEHGVKTKTNRNSNLHKLLN
ncbi:exodeoxyribonuclease V subunit alpha [Photobacterium kishitanii]|uniref:RecBCD enzyme subunit RecD n=1 Tax=Photobacterium kishitanii TaxID=318456 RepID=A0A2T3KM49_9GAMM|nr:exodeoxyribonuclease V subunit alpha [Photobacterium kishitanii]PSV00747.1 exodeoxyribonuclease V subunit alpha [Photobacterium kishitanii]